MDLHRWAETDFYLSAESSAKPGRWRTLPYQRGIMEALSDPTVETVSWMKPARVGATKLMGALIAYHMAHDPCPILLVQPTVEDAEGYSKDEIAPMLRDCPALAGLVVATRTSDAASTILTKVFRGGKLLLVGANSARGFRRVSARVIIFDEVDGYPPSAGDEGDQIRLGIMRGADFYNRKVFAASTPTIAGASRIEQLYLAGDQRRYLVPCPHCGVFDELVFRQVDSGRGHFMAWPAEAPAKAHFVCSSCARAIGHEHKRDMIAAGFWRASRPFEETIGTNGRGHASFHLWTGYSLAANATWGQLAVEYAEADRAGAEQLQTFVNTVLGEPWQQRGEAPEWQRLYARRESYEIGTVPAGVKLLTAGVDVQKDRLVYEVVGWGAGRESWSVEAGEIAGDTSSLDGPVWRHLDKLLASQWHRADGAALALAVLGIDSGYNTQVVYGWARRHGDRVMACKGQASASALLSAPRRVQVTFGGRLIPDGCKLWIVGVNIAKAELYGWLRLQLPDAAGAPFPAGFCHFPELPEEYFRQLTAEQLVTVRRRTGFATAEWQLLPGRQNHWLDARILARAVTAPAQLDRALRGSPLAAQLPLSSPPPGRPPAPAREAPRDPWLDGGREMGSRRDSFWRR